MASDSTTQKQSNQKVSRPTDYQRVSKACDAMRRLGIPSEDVRPILKNLLNSNDHNWELIEKDDYRTLADAIFKSAEEKKCKTSMLPDEQLLPLKRNQSGESEDDASSTRGKSSKTGLKTVETLEMLTPQKSLKSSQSGQSNKRMESNPDSHQAPFGYRTKGTFASKKDHLQTQITSQGVSSSTGSDPSTDETCIRKGNKKDDLIEENKTIAKPPHPVVQSTRFNSPRPVTAQQLHNTWDMGRPFQMDITNGMEKVKFSLLDEVGMPEFVYMSQNTIYENAHVHFSLAQIADKASCRGCRGDCLSSAIPCACAHRNGGQFPYTPQGQLKEDFIGACMNREPQEHEILRCEECPLETAKNALNPEGCKGHLLRKFIQECWRKCGCSMQCGNRVVQRGITCSLQVFSAKGKGWGLRTLEALPKGSFICEYVGEILTNMEQHKRNEQSQGNEIHKYPIYLDADWLVEQDSKDEEALCLDATYYGNVARFINHRCYDPNLLEIPVEVETPDHHYYHVAFFTIRNVKADEELTWDYGIDFEDVDHPVEAFKCRCASAFCRDPRRQS